MKKASITVSSFSLFVKAISSTSTFSLVISLLSPYSRSGPEPYLELAVERVGDTYERVDAGSTGARLEARDRRLAGGAKLTQLFLGKASSRSLLDDLLADLVDELLVRIGVGKPASEAAKRSFIRHTIRGIYL